MSNRLDIDDIDNDGVIIALDSTSINITNGVQWMADKWDIKNENKKGYLKIHIALNIKAKEILAL